MAPHPDLAAEQAYIDHAYACLESSRRGRHPPDVDGRGRPGRHRPGPVRARRHLRHGREPADAARSWATPRCASAGSTGSRRRPTASPRASTSAASRSPTPSRSRSSSTGGPRSPSRSTGPPGASPWAWPAAATSPPAAASCSAIEDELFGDTLDGLGMRRRRRRAPGHRSGRALHRARGGPHRPAGRHRRHHPGRAGRDHPRPAARRAGGAGRARAPARRWWRCTGPPTSSTPTGSRSRARACW